MIKLNCKNCGKKFNIPEIHANKKGICPKCKSTIIVPTIQTPSSSLQQKDSRNLKVSSKNSAYNSAILDVSPEDRISNDAIGQYRNSDRVSIDLQESAERSAVEEIEPAGSPKLPWLIDIFLYPLNLASVIHVICLWLLVFLLCPLVMEFLALGIEYIPIVYTLPIAYVLYYFTECIRDSANGRYRAPDFWMDPTGFDKWDCISRLLTVIGCIAVCFWPVAVYYVVTERTDLIYWLLLACGGFFFPMALLAVVLFDSYNALNPILLIGSIFHTFLPYCGMVLLFYGGALLFMKIDPRLYRLQLLPAVPFIFKALQLYLMFVAVGLLGRFYGKYQEKLNWEV